MDQMVWENWEGGRKENTKVPCLRLARTTGIEKDSAVSQSNVVIQ